MAILTKFLKLLKPERNDYVDVEKHLSENYDKIDTKMEELSNSNDKKLDKGTVSSEYDTAKKIEDKIKEAKRTADGKVSKAGDTMTGQLVIDTSEDSILLKEKGVNKCAIGNLYSGSAAGIYNHAAGKGIVLRNDGRVSIDAGNLNTNSKEVVAAINELNKDKLNKGAVSSEYDTAKKIEDKIKEAKRTADGKVSKAGDTMTGQLVIDTSEDSILLKEKGVNKCAIGNLYSGSAAGIYNHAAGKGIVLHNDGRVSIDAGNLNTNSKEVVAAINELNSRGFVKIGECLRVNQTVSVSGYNEFIVCEKFSPDKIIDIKYFTKNAINSLKNFAFLSYSSELECEWKFSSDRNIITLTKLGSADDGGIYVYGR